MANRQVDVRVVEKIISDISRYTHLTFCEACREIGIDESTVRRYRDVYAPRYGLHFPTFGNARQNPKAGTSKIISVRQSLEPKENAVEEILSLIRKAPSSIESLANRVCVSQGFVLDTLNEQKSRGVNIHHINGLWSIEKDIVPSYLRGPVFEYVSRPDNTFVFGATSDNHLGSKYERLDVLNDLYDRFEQRGVDRVFNAGNWIDGEARFNKFDLNVHGMNAQLKYLAENYPQRDGITTYAVAGDDHEGWYAQREGVDIGGYAENIMRANGREDWVNLGYMEAHIRLINANTGSEAILSVVHPGGGSSYALSYSIQKIIESLDGGEKPAVGLYGHYHKLWAGNIRNVWCLQTGCTEDQTPFMRKKKLEAHVGGAIVELEQDPETGAIIGFTPKLIRYFNKGFYNNRWNHADGVNLPTRSI